MPKKILKHGLIAIALVLFMGVAALPMEGILLSTPVSEQDDTNGPGFIDDTIQTKIITGTVSSYGPEGLIDCQQVKLSQVRAEHLDAQLSAANSLEQIYDILREYQLIPKEASVNVFIEKLKQIDMLPADIWLPPFAVCFFSQISATFRWGGAFHLGMTPFLRFINRFLKSDLYRGIDVADMCWGLRGNVFLKGALGEHTLYLQPGFLVLAGFVGYAVDFPLLRHSLYGAAMITISGGLGDHDFDPWFP